MVRLSEQDLDKASNGVNQLLEPLGFIIMKDPKQPGKFYVQVLAKQGHEEDVLQVLRWIGGFITDPSETLRKTFWNGDETE